MNHEVIDIHSHMLLGVDDGWMFRSGLLQPLPKGGALLNLKGLALHASEDLVSLDKQKEVLADSQVTRRIISSVEAIHLLSTFAGRQTLEIAKWVNDAVAEAVADGAGSLAGMASVNPFEASHVAELERAVTELKLTGVCVPTSWDRLYLDSGLADPFYECAEDMNLPIFIHPPLVPLGYEEMQQYRLAEVCGRVFDTTFSVTRMIYAGVFDRYPGLKVIVPHMGAGLMSVMGRLDMGYRLGYEGVPAYDRARCKLKPSEYLKNLYVDTMGFWPSMIEQLIAVMGSDHILFGSDYPAVPFSPDEHIAIIRALGLEKEEEEAIFFRNAVRLFQLDAGI